VSSTRADGTKPQLSPDELATVLSTLQAEVVGLKTRFSEAVTRNEALEETIVNLTHENELLKRRIYGNKTERTRTSELQLTLGSLLDAEKQLQMELDAAVAKARGDGDGPDSPPAAGAPRPKPTGRRDLSASSLPRFLLEIRDEELEQTGSSSAGRARCS
jgi:hypothetical protein